MRNKIKQLLKKEGGFTLIELLAVIAILALIVAISIPLIGNVVSKAKTDTNDAQKELVVDAAQMYFLQPDNTEETSVDADALKTGGYLESKDNEMPNYTVTKEDNNYTIE